MSSLKKYFKHIRNILRKFSTILGSLFEMRGGQNVKYKSRKSTVPIYAERSLKDGVLETDPISWKILFKGCNHIPSAEPRVSHLERRDCDRTLEKFTDE